MVRGEQAEFGASR